MKINDLIRIADKHYDDGLLSQQWDFERGIPKPSSAGDTLALFIVRELDDVFDESISDKEQLISAFEAITVATDQLIELTKGLLLTITTKELL